MMPLLTGLLGGIGLFLLGMILLTDGLKTLAGERLKQALIRFTGTPGKAFVSGTLITLVVQSSSATTVAVIGFVSAGLLSFPQALGVVFGASLGTTGTGWIVAVLGLKISLGSYALPLVGVGAFLCLLGRSSWRSLGFSLAGFGLIFLGIATLQEGMEVLAHKVPFTNLAGGGFASHVAAMVVGLALTLILQSSSAAVATTLTALHAGALAFDQAASLVIGAAIGTTITAVLAAIGANVPAKRTALGFVLFNVSTGLVAIVMLPIFLGLIGWAQRAWGLEPGAVSLAAFHTLFIGLGVLIFLPWVGTYARWIERLLPDRGPALTRHLDRSLLATPPVALEATRRALRETAVLVLESVRGLLREESPREEIQRAGEETEAALQAMQAFLTRIPAQSPGEPWSRHRVSLFHALDHVNRCGSRLRVWPALLTSKERMEIDAPRKKLLHLLDVALPILHDSEPFRKPEQGQDVGCCAEQGFPEAELEKSLVEKIRHIAECAGELAAMRRRERESALMKIPQGDGAEAPLGILDSLRWLDRVGYHAWRATVHLVGASPYEDIGQELHTRMYADLL